jgi:cathepsin A (carboxypeptidase C)
MLPFVDDVLTHPDHPSYRLRVTSTSNSGTGTTMPHLCDPSVKMISGYLDVSETKHLFFWFFESRDKPKEDPLLLW